MYMNWRKWLDEFVLAGKGILLAARTPKFWYGFVPSFLFFGLLMNLLNGGTAKFELMAALGFPESLQIIGSSFLAIFGINQPFLDWLPIFAISVLQGVLIGIIVLLWEKKRRPGASANSASPLKNSKSPQNSIKTSSNSESLEKAGLITGLIALGAGCPTCGATLITPLVGAFVSTGSLAIAGAISTIVTWLAIIIAILALKRLGEETYVIIVNEKYLAKKAKEAKTAKTAQAVKKTKKAKSANKPSKESKS